MKLKSILLGGLAAATMLFPILGSAKSAQAYYETYATICTRYSPLTLRSAPSTKSRNLYQVPKGSTWYVYDSVYSEGYSWYQIYVYGVGYGWVRGDYLCINDYWYGH